MTKTMKLALLFWALVGAPSVVLAGGIAIVQAPEQSFGVCVGESAAKAFACVIEKCVKGGALPEDCLEMTYCDSSWTVDIFMQSTEGPHWHEYRCGWTTRAEAEAAGVLACNPERKKQLMECATVQIYDPDGKPQMPE